VRKHLFHMVSRGSSNTIDVYGGIRGKMKKKGILLLMVVMFAAMMLNVAFAQLTLDVTPSSVKPGEAVAISGTGTVGSTIIIEVMNSRTTVKSFNITVDSTGQFSVTYQLPANATIDIYTVKMEEGEETVQKTFIVSNMTPQQLVNTIKTLAAIARKQAETALIEAKNQGKQVPPDILDKYNQGVNELDKATNAIQSQNYVAAKASLQQAMNMFREVVKYSYEDNVEPPVDADQLKIRVQERIDQLNHQYTEINAVVKKLRAYGLNVDTLETELNTLRSMIGEAQNLLNEGRTAEAEQRVNRIQQLVTQRLQALRQRQSEVTKRLAERYQKSLENRVEAYIYTFQRLQSIRPVQSALALQELNTLRQKLGDSDTLINTGNVTTALQEMQNTEHRFKKLADTVNGPVTSRLLNRIDELTANIQNAPSTDLNQLQNELNQTRDNLKDYLSKHQSTRQSNSQLNSGS
jgi:hypothetical protein